LSRSGTASAAADAVLGSIMESFFSKLTDIGLRRLYKFILKRTIGIYLESELLIEQLHVSSRDGMVTLNDLKLSCDLINEDYLR
jgi:hypothetical protein